MLKTLKIKYTVNIINILETSNDTCSVKLCFNSFEKSMFYIMSILFLKILMKNQNDTLSNRKGKFHNLKNSRINTR